MRQVHAGQGLGPGWALRAGPLQGHQSLPTGQPKAGGAAGRGGRGGGMGKACWLWPLGTPALTRFRTGEGRGLQGAAPPGHAPCAQLAAGAPGSSPFSRLYAQCTHLSCLQSHGTCVNHAASSRHRVTTMFGEGKSFGRGLGLLSCGGRGTAGEWRGGTSRGGAGGS